MASLVQELHQVIKACETCQRDEHAAQTSAPSLLTLYCESPWASLLPLLCQELLVTCAHAPPKPDVHSKPLFVKTEDKQQNCSRNGFHSSRRDGVGERLWLFTALWRMLFTSNRTPFPDIRLDEKAQPCARHTTQFLSWGVTFEDTESYASCSKQECFNGKPERNVEIFFF